MSERLPRAFGPFQLEVKLGQGGMAEVFRARVFGASGFEKRVVVKTLREELVGTPELERMFLEEARLQALLFHRNLVQAHEFGVVDGRPWVRLDWVDGVELGALALPLAAPLVRFIGAEVALGLHALHQATDEQGRPLGVVHRDVSPTNVLVSKLGEVKLSDFGIARATQLREQTRAGVRKGTHAYMSPEQVSGRALSVASDQFSLAVLLVELLTGARPFEGGTPLETMDLIREAAPPALPGREPALEAVLLRALSKDPAQRFGTSEAFRAAVQASGPVADELELARVVAGAKPGAAATVQTRIDSAISE
ncbi:MAG: serine/threonine-protein kinase [Myxococcaceae bacterium]